MSLYVTVKIDIKTDKFTHESNVNIEGIKTIVENVLLSHMGIGADKTPPIRKDNYEITIYWDLSDDSFTVKSDTNNKSLTDGILLCFLRRLVKNERSSTTN